jgi:hypothetical protein
MNFAEIQTILPTGMPEPREKVKPTILDTNVRADKKS